MLIWLKKNWKCLLGAIGTLGLSLLFKKIKDSRDNEKLDDLKDDEQEVVENFHDQVVGGIKNASEKHSNEIKDANQKANDANQKAEDKKNNREKELIEDSEKIDNVLDKFGIKEVK